MFSTIRKVLFMVAPLAFFATMSGAAAATPDVGVQYANSDCTTLRSQAGAHAEVCKTWQTEADGHGWFGAASVRNFPGTYVQAMRVPDNGAPEVIWNVTGVQAATVYANAAEFRLRACSSNCGFWW